ncbi:MAG: hypothetical protein NT076_02485 [Candidatus Pacearchaeota archaeon]|nr:hypothetical protein [Candidatus Pacearchaeota archaeon]
MAVKPEKEENPFNKQVEGYYRPAFKQREEEEHIAVPLQKPLKRNAEAPQEEKQIVEDKWAEKSNEVLKETGSTKRVVDPGNGQEVYSKTWHNFLIVFFVLTIIAGIGWFGYLGYTDHFKTEVSVNNTNVCAEIPKCPEPPVIPKCPDCSLSCGNYSFNPTMICPELAGNSSI